MSSPRKQGSCEKLYHQEIPAYAGMTEKNMELTKEQIKHIANLARLELTEAEIKTYDEQLSNILNYIDQLKEVKTEGVDPTAQVTGLKNVFREDRVKDWNEEEREAAFEQAPEKENDEYKVKRIL